MDHRIGCLESLGCGQVGPARKGDAEGRPGHLLLDKQKVIRRKLLDQLATQDAAYGEVRVLELRPDQDDT